MHTKPNLSVIPFDARNPRAGDGFTLIEFLITLVLVSVGLLSVAFVITNSLKSNHSAYHRSQSTMLATDIIDRMRANRVTAEAANPSPYNVAIGSAPTGGGVVLDDLVAWRAALAATFPSGTGSVNLDNGTKKVTVIVQWDDSRGSGGGTTQQFTFETRL